MLTVISGDRSDVGLVRRHNEDGLLNGSSIWAVADGMGGHAAGEVASALVIDELSSLDGRDDLRPGDVVKAVGAAHDRIVDHGLRHTAARGLGSTVTGLALVTVGGSPHWAVFNVGDSRVYRYWSGLLQRATIDHSEAEELVLEGVITAEEARSHHSRHVVTRSLGQPGSPQVDLWLLPQTAGERFLICSDGLSGEIEDAALAEILAATPGAADAASSLVEAALRHGGRDNVSAIVINVEGVEAEVAQTAPRPREEVAS